METFVYSLELDKQTQLYVLTMIFDTYYKATFGDTTIDVSAKIAIIIADFKKIDDQT